VSKSCTDLPVDFPLDTNRRSWSDDDMTNTCSDSVLLYPAFGGQVRSFDLDWDDEPAFEYEAVPVESTRRTSARVVRRRALLAAAAVAMLIMLALPWGGTGGHSLAAPGAARGGLLVAGSTYVVQPGDTIWGIAERLVGNGDPRPMVSELESEAGGDVLQPGQQLRLP
jgi:LysM domain